MNIDEKNILRTALETYGDFAQILMCIEECAELTNVLAKLPRNRVNEADIITELADVSIMIDQLSIMYGELQVSEERQRKLARLKERLEKSRKGCMP